MSNFALRAITGILYVIVMVGAILWHPLLVIGLFGVFAFLGLREFYLMMQLQGLGKSTVNRGAIGGLFIYLSFATGIIELELSKVFFLISCSLPFVFVIIELYSKSKKPFINLSILVGGWVFVILPFACLLYLMNGASIPFHHYNTHLLLAFFIMLWCNDTGAYLVGKSIGKHKLLERISPKKTWEGYIGGIILAAIAGYIYASCVGEKAIYYAIYGVIIGVFGTFGDLSMSMLKRSVGVKDTGTLLPGHGGILDRLDGVLIAAPILVLFIHFFRVIFS